jgi:hypothetical protein
MLSLITLLLYIKIPVAINELEKLDINIDAETAIGKRLQLLSLRDLADEKINSDNEVSFQDLKSEFLGLNHSFDCAQSSV